MRGERDAWDALRVVAMGPMVAIGAGGRPVALDRDGERQEGEEPNSARAAAIYDHGRRRTESGYVPV